MNSINLPRSRVAVIGTGLVGSSFAYALTIKGAVHELALINRSQEKAEGEAMDLNHGLSFTSPMDIEAGGYELCKDAHIVVVTAGASQKPGETRLDLTKRNTGIVRDVVRNVLQHNPSPIILVATNPVDVLTWVALRESGLPPNMVMGSGTLLDSSRFRYLLSEHCDVDPRSVHAHIIGEHGESELAAWSRVNISGVPLDEFCQLCKHVCPLSFRKDIVQAVKNAADEIIQRKEATYYAIGLALARIVEAVLKDQNSVLTVSTLIEDYYGISDVCLSLPTIVGAQGAAKTIHAALADDEVKALRRSAEVLRQGIAEAGY